MIGIQSGNGLGWFPYVWGLVSKQNRNESLSLPALEWWKTNEGSGTSLATQSGSGDTLSFTGTWTNPGAFFPFVVPTFNGSTQSALGANFTNTNVSFQTPFSISVWVNQTASPAGNAVIIGDINGSSVGWELAITSAGLLTALAINTFPSSYLNVQSSGTVSNNALHHIVWTNDGTGSAAGSFFYIDGVKQTTSTLNNTLVGSAASGIAVTVGNRAAASSWFTGAIADIRLFGAALTQAQVTVLKNGGVV